MRVRGLKLHRRRIPCMLAEVAPHAGAWIETLLETCTGSPQLVAPHAGAWIETKYSRVPQSLTHSSHPMRVRGLKHYNYSTGETIVISRTPCGCVD